MYIDVQCYKNIIFNDIIINCNDIKNESKRIGKFIFNKGDNEIEENSYYIANRNSINWKKYDDELSIILEKFANDIYNGTTNKIGRPERVSGKIIYRELGLSKYRLGNMPKCQEIFKKYTESYPEHYARRIIWAYQKLKEKKKDMPIYWTDIQKLANINKKDFKAAIPYLGEYTDQATKEFIINLVKMD